MIGKRTHFTYIVPIPLGLLDRLDVFDDVFDVAGKVMRTKGPLGDDFFA